MAHPPRSRRYVRVTERDEQWVEFEFSIGDPKIFVELVMPPEQFRQFCLEQVACQLPALSPDPSPAGGRGENTHGI